MTTTSTTTGCKHELTGTDAKNPAEAGFFDSA
jgi:hypothetical protein